MKKIENKVGKIKKKKKSAPKLRHTWEINPKTRVKEDEDAYERAKQKLEDKREIDGLIDFFGDK